MGTRTNYSPTRPSVINIPNRPPARHGKVTPVRVRKPVVNRHGVVVGEK